MRYILRNGKWGVLPTKRDDITVLTCAKCMSMVAFPGKQVLKSCPNCGCDGKDGRANARYWRNGKPDYSFNLLEGKSDMGREEFMAVLRPAVKELLGMDVD